MSDSESWGAGTTSEAAESSEAYVPTEPKKRRKSKKKSLESDSDVSPPRRRSPRRSSPRRNSNKPQKGAILNLDASSDEDENQENTQIIANINLNSKRRSSSTKSRRKSSENSNNSKRRKSKEKKKKKSEDEEDYEPTSTAMEIEEDADDEAEVESPQAPKKRGRKRKLSEADIDHDDATNPPPKKQRTSTSSNSNSNNSKAKSTKKAKGKNDKKKKKTYKGSDATEQIRKKMLETNRPWTASALRSEMNETIGIAQVKKSLAELHEDGILSMREFGKKKKSKTMVYWPDQDEMDDDEYDEMKTQQRIQELEHLVKQKRAEMNRIKSKCQRLQGQPTDAQIKVQMEEAWRNNETAKKEMADLEGDGNQRVSEKDKEDLLCQANVYLKAWKERMDKVWDMINMIFQDSADKPPKLLTGKIGGDTDKANGVDWNDYKEMYKESRIIVQRRKDDKKAKKR